MARPPQADAEATRANILDTAARCFSELGVGQASMRHIAREAGVSQSTIHHYFTSKDLLYEACIESMYSELNELREVLGERSLTLEDPRAFVEEVIHEAYHFGRTHASATRLVMRDVLDHGELRLNEGVSALTELLNLGGPLISQLTGIPEQEVRLSMFSINILMTRFTLAQPREIARVLDIDAGSMEKDELTALADRHAIDHLVKLTWKLFGLTDQ